MKNTEKTFHWSELHESHLRRSIDRLMLDEGGKLEIVNSKLKDDSPRSAIPFVNRRVVFDKDFVIYRIIRLLGALEWYEVKKILKDFSASIKGSESVPKFLSEVFVSSHHEEITIPGKDSQYDHLPLPFCGEGETMYEMPLSPEAPPLKTAPSKTVEVSSSPEKLVAKTEEAQEVKTQEIVTETKEPLDKKEAALGSGGKNPEKARKQAKA